MTSYGLSEVVLHSGGAHIYGVTQAPCRPPCRGEESWYKNSHNFVAKIKYDWNNFIWALNVIIYHPNFKYIYFIHFLLYILFQNLADNKIGTNGSRPICEMMVSNSTLTHVNLSGMVQ